MTNKPSDDEFERMLQFYLLSDDLRSATNKNLDEIAELAYTKLDLDFDDCDFESQLHDLHNEVRTIIDDLKAKYGGNPYNEEKFKTEINSNRELNLHLKNLAKVVKIIHQIKTEFNLDEENLDFASKIANLVSNVIKVHAQKDIIPLIHRGLYAEDIKSALDFWDKNASSEEGKLESTWQNEFTSRKSILERVIGGRVSLLQPQAHVGGNSLNGKGDKITDYMFQHSDTRNVTLIEIKTPHTKLLGNSYRGTYSLSNDLSGTIAQVLIQRSDLIKHYFSKVHESPIPFEVNAPKCYIVVGNIGEEFGDIEEKKIAFEIHRHAVGAAVTIISFDELYDQFSKFNVAA